MLAELRESIDWHLGRGLALGAAMVAAVQALIWLDLGRYEYRALAALSLTAFFAERGFKSLEQRLGRRLQLGQVVAMVAVMTLVAGVIHQLYLFLYINYIDPSWLATAADTGFLSRWQTDYPFTQGLAFFVLQNGLFGGLLAIFGADEKKRNDRARRAA